MKYACINCSYVYDLSLGDEKEGIAPGTSIEHQSCPDCGAFESFSHIIPEMHYISDNSFDTLNHEHFLETEQKEGKIIVTIGGNRHPMGVDHRISAVELYDEYGDIVDRKILKIDDDTTIEFDDFDLGGYEIRVYCNLHGIFAKKFENFI